MAFQNEAIERMERGELDDFIDKRIRATIRYANEHSAFYRHWFRVNNIRPEKIREHPDLLQLPIISGKTIREHQPPAFEEFEFLSADWKDIFTIQETSGTSGTPKSFFFTWDDWKRYAEKYARIFVSQGLTKNDRIVVCTSYGMNVGANTMTVAAKRLGIGLIPMGNCNFPSRVLTMYRPTAIIGSVFKLLNLRQRLAAEKIKPEDLAIQRLIVGGEGFAEESRFWLEEQWGCPVYNTYGSTEGTMCGECEKVTGLHVPEDLVHLDIYDPGMGAFVHDGECGRGVLTTLVPEGSKCGTLLINYDTEDTTVIISRERCACGRTHMRIANPQREAETFWVYTTPFNRVDVEASVFQRQNMEHLTGEYEAFIYDGETTDHAVLRVSLECSDPEHCDTAGIQQTFIETFLKRKAGLAAHFTDGTFSIRFNFTPPGGLELSKLKGRPRRLIDRRSH